MIGRRLRRLIFLLSMKYSYLLIFITPLVVFGLFESMLFYPLFFGRFLLGIIFLISLSLFIFADFGRFKPSWWNILFLPFVFSVSLAIYSSLLSNRTIIHLLFAVGAIFIWSYLRNSYYFFVKDSDGKGRLLENLSAYGGFLAFFFLGTSAYGLKSFFGISLVLLATGLFLGILLIIYQNIWVNSFKLKDGGIFIPIIFLILAEMAAAIYYLPLNYNALGLILAICYYMLIGLLKAHLRKNLNKQSVKFYLFFGLLSFLAIFLSSKWDLR